ncbi:MAG: DUF4249 domain-containing protein [Bacteroidales bacterium]|nr:DUF4249 domain-containing protein [Bacteroidales bacterium]
MKKDNCNKPHRLQSIIPLLLLTLIALTGCEEIMDVSFNSNASPNIVVRGSISTDARAHRVILTYTTDYFHPDTLMATGATVSITDGVNTFSLEETEEGTYYTAENVRGIAGRYYTLQVTLPDGRQYSATDYIYPAGGFDSIAQTGNHKTHYSGYGYNVLFYGQEPQPEGHCYLFMLYKDDMVYSDTVTEVAFADDAFINGIYVKDYPVYRIRESDLTDAARVTLEMHTVSRAYYEFLSALMLETVWKGSPWDGPPANIPGNVSNGGKGFFRASSTKRQSKVFYPTLRTN